MTYVAREEAPGALAVPPPTIPAPMSAAVVLATVAAPIHLTGVPWTIARLELAIIPALGPLFNEPGRKIPVSSVPVTSAGQSSPLGPDQVKEYPFVVAHAFNPPLLYFSPRYHTFGSRLVIVLPPMSRAQTPLMGIWLAEISIPGPVTSANAALRN